MGQIITEKCIRLNYLCRFLDMLRKEEKHHDDKILLSVDESTKSYELFKGDIRQVIIEDVAYDNDERLIKFYCITNHNPDFGEIPEKDEMELYEFFSIMYWPFDERRNAFRPLVAVDWQEDHLEYSYVGDTIPPAESRIKDLRAPIKHIYCRYSLSPTNTCVIFISTDDEGF